MNFRHFVITNFQYPSNFAFLDERLELFNKLTIPSMMNQTCKRFTWIIIVNTLTDELFIPSDLGFKCMIISNKEFKSLLLNQKADHIVTTRLDNGDLLHPKFIEEVQKMTRAESGCYLIDIDFLNYDVRNKLIFRGRKDLLSPFVSLVEPLFRGILPRTIHRRSYRDLNASRKVKKIKSKLYCVQSIHDYIDIISAHPYEEPVIKFGKRLDSKGKFFNKYTNKLI